MPPPPTVLITGAAQRIGRTLALTFAANGWRVGLHCRSSQREAAQLAAEIAGKGGAAAVLEADLADAAQVEGLLPACAVALGAPSCLINNASMFVFDDVATSIRRSGMSRWR
jgi:NAD(P)-dependent dehydrogenase (short-subunit alcohol dehydrogenase family)